MNDLEREKILLEAHVLIEKSNALFWLCVLVIVAIVGTAIAIFQIGSHFALLGAALFILARFILMPKGIEYNREAKALLDKLPD